MLKTKIKASSITNLTDARYFAAWDVEWIGFDLDPASETFIEPVKALAIREWVEGPKIVGEFGMQPAEEINSLIETLQLDMVQVGMFTPLETLTELEGDLPVIREIVVQKDTTPEQLQEAFEQYAAQVAVFLLNFEKNGINWKDLEAGTPVSLEWLKEYCSNYAVILGIAGMYDALEPIVNDIKPNGLHLIGGEEEKVGLKSFEELDDIFEDLEVFD